MKGWHDEQLGEVRGVTAGGGQWEEANRSNGQSRQFLTIIITTVMRYEV